ncbi:MAG TPA: hypothetical protein VNI20_03315 [Fimbriimonadaceae bacterium]|nr:hypothetical protein [Fimbriimonadaceae bacterium]
MKRRIVLILVFALAIAAVAPAQLTADQKANSDRILTKVRKLDMYNQVLPVLFTKDQIKAILPVLEEHRANASNQEMDENKMMLGWEKDLDEQLKRCKDKGEMPKPEVLNMANIYFKVFAMKRKAIVDDAVEKLKEVLKDKCNDGQLKAAENALDPRNYVPDADPAKMTDDEKLDMWIRLVLIDKNTYDILVDLSKK